MKRLVNLTLLSTLTAFSPLALAETENNSQEEQNLRASGLEFVIGAGITFGGDDLLDVNFTDGTSESLEAGGFIDFKAGLEYYFQSSNVSLQTTVGYHFDTVSASNGDATFSRIPFDALAFYHIDQHRLGFGATLHTGAEFDADFGSLGVDGKADFDDATGFVFEYGYRIKRSPATIAVRLVDIEYEVSDSIGSEIDGSHVGIYAYFNF